MEESSKEIIQFIWKLKSLRRFLAQSPEVFHIGLPKQLQAAVFVIMKLHVRMLNFTELAQYEHIS